MSNPFGGSGLETRSWILFDVISPSSRAGGPAPRRWDDKQSYLIWNNKEG